MTLYTVKTYHPEYKAQWNTFVEEAKNATFLFNRSFIEYHQDKFEDASTLIYKNKELIAVFPANKSANTIYSHQGLTYGGLVIKPNLKFQSVLACFQELLKFYSQEGFLNLELKIMPSIYSEVPSDESLYLMFLLQAELVRRDSLSVISQSKKIKFSKDRIDGVKRGKKNGLIIKEDAEFDSFWNEILIPNLEFKHQAKPVHSLNEIKLLKKRFPKNIKQYNVYDNEKLVAGTTIFITKQVAHSQYISGNENKNQLGSLDFLHDYLINEVFKDKAYFDFGISNENNGSQVNSGLQYWKEGFGARIIVQDFYKITMSNYTKLDTVLI